MNFLFKIVLFIGCLGSAIAQTKRVVCFYDNQALSRTGNGMYSIGDIELEYCTHLVYASARISKTAAILPTTDADISGFQQIVNVKQSYPDLKVLISIGGPYQDLSVYQEITNLGPLRIDFVTNVTRFINQYGFDGVNIDWQYPLTLESGDMFIVNLLVRLLREEWGPSNKMITTSFGKASMYFSGDYDMTGLFNAADFVNLLGYNMNDESDGVTGHHSALGPKSTIPELQHRTIENVVDKLLMTRGVVASKLVLGVPFFGRTLKLLDASNNGIGAIVTDIGISGPYTLQRGYISYYEICEEFAKNGWQQVLNPLVRSPYAYKNLDWISYENVESVAAKGSFVIEKGLGGVMIYSVDLDDKNNICGEGTNPLLKSISNTVNGIVECPPIVDPPPAILYPECPWDTCTISNDGYFVDIDPTKYHLCIYKGCGHCVVESLHCENGFKFDIAKKSCVLIDIIDPSQIYCPETNCEVKDRVRYVHSDPTKYYYCAANGSNSCILRVYTCDTGLVYNDTEKFCVRP